MAKKSTSFTIYQQGKAEMSRLPLHIGLELIRRLNQKQHEKSQSSKTSSSLCKHAS